MMVMMMIAGHPIHGHLFIQGGLCSLDCSFGGEIFEKICLGDDNRRQTTTQSVLLKWFAGRTRTIESERDEMRREPDSSQLALDV